MTLILTEEDTRDLMDMGNCIRALEETFCDFGNGVAVSRPRTHTYTWLEPHTFYNFKSMDGCVPRFGVHALRISSEILQTQTHFGRLREEKVARAEGARFVGLLILFDIQTTEPLAIIQEASVQRMRVGATSGIAAKFLARKDARRVGMFGSGWQARPQLEALSHVRSIEHVKIYSPNPENRTRFAADMTKIFDFPLIAVDNPREVVRDVDIIVCATNSQQPVFEGAWLEAGQHINSLQAGELDLETHMRAEVIGVRAFEKSTSYVQEASPERPIHAEKLEKFSQSGLDKKFVALGPIVAGQKTGRERDDQITLFGGSGTGPSSGLGIQFAAVGKLVYDAALKAGKGTKIPTEWLLQNHHP